MASRPAMGRGVRDFPDFYRFLSALPGAHAQILSARPDQRPGEFKAVVNVVRSTRSTMGMAGSPARS